MSVERGIAKSGVVSKLIDLVFCFEWKCIRSRVDTVSGYVQAKL